MEDAQLAKSLDEGAEAKHTSLKQPNYTNQVAIALRQAALSVAAKQGLPGPSSLPHGLNSSATTDTFPMVDTHEIFVSRLLTAEHVSGLGISSDLLYPYTERPKTPAMFNAATPKQDDNIFPPTQPPLQTLCIICEDPIASTNATRTPCGHDYCKDCIISYVDASTRDNSLLPVRCCNVPIPQKAIVSFLTNPLLSFYEDKSRELEVPVNHRVYCQNPDCSKFLGSTRSLEGNITCSGCGSSTCATCRQSAHTGESCSDNAGILEVKALARVEHWQTCPGCNAIIELQHGCYHMTCRCATQFCYLCAAKWKTCTCPQSDERCL
ncbi:hypothetical protein BDZ94DRAFT_784601 [Collybia nuda]|uniref:RBR-type E3 ubiquitin transferase n=1 Tax=Collybia nuda TaxID=64659 RepID=A0A9P6CQ88_9AGAR|nr:hypothetical protein BDZ94DRAFT_784601 [Collybia nuda]